MKIEAIDVTLVDVPASRPIQMSFTTMQKQRSAIVQIRAGGLVGIGEGSSVGGPSWSSECAENIKRWEERRVGKEGGRTMRYGGSPNHYKKHNIRTTQRCRT